MIVARLPQEIHDLVDHLATTSRLENGFTEIPSPLLLAYPRRPAVTTLAW